ncbi:MAG: amino acid ABC transporter permease [Mangrovicoccus sp.]
MASIDTDPQAPPSFNWGMLFSDTRYRGITFQIIALIALVFFFGWLGFNAFYNLQALGKDISFEFLGQQANYDINPALIEFSSVDTHFRAAIVGVLNTLLVAFLGCVTATVLGVIVGVLRLSNNWIVARLMAVYVEIFRNVPLLIWILIIISAVSISMPHPRSFAGDDATSSMLFGAFAFTNQGVYLPKPIWLEGSSVVVGVFIASLVGIVAVRRYAVYALYNKGQEIPSGWISLGLFFVPVILAFFIMGRPIDLEFATLSRFGFRGGVHVLDTLIALWLALSLYTGAFIAENVRGGIISVSKGQTEAAASLGLRPGRIMSLVVLPQALRVIIPPLISQYLNLTKNTSLAAAIGYADITGTLGGVTLNQTGRSFEAVLLMMVFYLLISLTISLVMNVYNNTVKLKER